MKVVPLFSRSRSDTPAKDRPVTYVPHSPWIGKHATSVDDLDLAFYVPGHLYLLVKHIHHVRIFDPLIRYGVYNAPFKQVYKA